jgi:hypothetical protein
VFTIQYQAVNGEHKTQAFDSHSRTKLVKHLAHFEQPIMAVYEQATVITKAVRTELAKLPPTSISRAARDFVRSTI